MADIEIHYLRCRGLKKLLIDAGMVSPRILTCQSSPNGAEFPNVLDFGKCNPAAWEKRKKEILAAGTLETFYSEEKQCFDAFWRKYTPDEEAQMGLYPVIFNEKGDEMQWISRWRENFEPAFYVSTAFPRKKMSLTQYFEGQFDGRYLIRNGKPVKEGRMRRFLRKLKARGKEA